jgi:hypothetical protein
MERCRYVVECHSASTDRRKGDGRGIVPLTPEEMRGKEIAEGPSKHGHIAFHSASSDSVLDSAEAHYVDTATNPEDSKAKKALKSRFTSKGITERLLRKTLKKNTWIYVCGAWVY